MQRSRLERAWLADLPDSQVPHVVIALTSYSLDRSVLEHYGARVAPLENRFLYVALRARDPFTRIVYLSSRPIGPEVIDAYLALAPPEDHERILQRTLLLSPDDVSVGSLASKVLQRPDLIDQIQRFVGDDLVLMEPWNVTEAERDLAVALRAPLNGTDPALARLATKTGARELFRRVGVPLAAGIEGVTTPAEVAAAISELDAAGSIPEGVVVKLDDSVAGDGNIVLRRSELDASGDIPGRVASALPDWYVEDLRAGGVVEALVTGDDFTSPSGQAEIHPDGSVKVLATHDQRLGGESGQVFEGCTFPANPSYAVTIAQHVATVGRELASEGAVGRFAVDFAAVRDGSSWRLFALEINLRKGGTTHPYGVMRMLTAGAYEPDAARFRLLDGSVRYYAATDNLVDDAWIGRTPSFARALLDEAGLFFDRHSNTGVVPHLLDCLEVDGRMGYTAIGKSPEDVRQLEKEIAAALR